MTPTMHDANPNPNSTMSEARMTHPTTPPNRSARSARASVSVLALLLATTTAMAEQDAGRLVPTEPPQLPDIVETLPETMGQIATGYAGLEDKLGAIIAEFEACMATARRDASTGSVSSGAPAQAPATQTINEATCYVEYLTQRNQLSTSEAEIGLDAEEQLNLRAGELRREQEAVGRHRQEALARAEAAKRDLESIKQDGLPREVERLREVPAEARTPADIKVLGQFRRYLAALVNDERAATAQAADFAHQEAYLGQLANVLETWAVGFGEHARDQALLTQSRNYQMEAVMRGAEGQAMGEVTLGTLPTIAGLIGTLSQTDEERGITPPQGLDAPPQMAPLPFPTEGEDDLTAILELLGVDPAAPDQTEGQ